MTTSRHQVADTPPTYCLPPTAYRSPTAHCSPLTAHCSPLTAHRSPLTAHRSLLQARHPDTPFIMYIAKSAALLERMAATGERSHTTYIYQSHSKQSHRWTHHSPLTTHQDDLSPTYLATRLRHRHRLGGLDGHDEGGARAARPRCRRAGQPRIGCPARPPPPVETTAPWPQGTMAPRPMAPRH